MRRGSPFLWLLFGVLGLTLVLLVSRGGEGVIMGLESGRFAQVVFLVLLLLFLVFQVGGRNGLSRTIRYALVWALILSATLIGYSYRFEIEDAFRNLTGALPDQAVVQTAGGDEVVVNRRRGGHFVVVATLNNAPIELMVDTGASVVTLTPEDARLIGIPTRDLNYRVQVQTANGTALAAAVVLDRIAIGPIERRRVAALVTQPGMLETSLLGLNFLNSLESYAFSNGKLILTP